MVESSRLDTHEYLVGFERREILNADLNDFRTSRTQRSSDSALSNGAHHAAEEYRFLSLRP